MRKARSVAILALILNTALFSVQAEQTAETKAAEARRQAEELVAQGDRWQESGRFELALSHYVRASQLDPRNSMAFRQAGKCLRELERFEEAIPYLKEATRLDPTASRPWANLGLAYGEIYDRTKSELRELAGNEPHGSPNTDHPINNRMNVRRRARSRVRPLRKAVPTATSRVLVSSHSITRTRPTSARRSSRRHAPQVLVLVPSEQGNKERACRRH
jgi:tetratricopeptide (TPR) repeat protein